MDAVSHSEKHDRQPIHSSLQEFIVMTMIRTLCTAIFLTSLALTAPAQAQSAGASAPAAAAMPRDCAKPMAKHDHAAEKGNPRPASVADGCPPASAKSTLTAASAAEKKRLKHIHARDGK